MQKHILPTTCLAAVMLLGAIPGQIFPVPSTALPATGGCNVIPFGSSSLSTTWANQRYQCMAMVADLGGTNTVGNICELAFAPCGTTGFIRNPSEPTWEGQVQAMRSWIHQRAAWLDGQLNNM